MKREYGFVFPLGAACSCSQSLRLAGLQFASYPFDWLYGGSPSVRAKGLADGFDGWFDEALLSKRTLPWKLEHEAYANVENGIVFKHDFDWNRPLSATLPAVREKYARRLERLRSRIGEADSVLAVWICPPGAEVPKDEEFERARLAVAAPWPGKDVRLLAVECEPGRTAADCAVRSLGGTEIVSFDYDDGRDQFIDNAAMAKFLASRISAPDTRTPEERKAWPAKRRALKYAQYNASSWWQYAVNRAQYRLYRHFRRLVERKGLDRLG